ncbi:MAG: quinone-dependent dihydroorotate dehydrogenase [Bacteroidales bacterium]|nr:quinone-dependent dihydroorotate dehydrogenase [Bacteroidales bacterium]
MNIYKFFIKPLLFKMQPEKAHKVIFNFLKLPGSNFFLKLLFKFESKTLHFEKSNFKVNNPIGLAAGLDKDGEVINQLGNIGFGFVEIGTVTPLAQPGNPKPRLFRLVKDQALINRMGFNNNGAASMVEKLKKIKPNTTIGINLGKNKITPLEDAHNDYVKSFELLFDFGDYFVVNVSSPNTPNLRQLQDKEFLRKILKELQQINLSKPNQKPLFIKIAPDLSHQQIDEIIEIVVEEKLTGIIATNTTIERKNLSLTKQEIENYGSGGLSGKPLKEKSTEIIRYIKSKINDSIVLIGVGGIFDIKDIEEMLSAGADVVQIYTSFIYEGPGVVKKLKKAMIKNKTVNKN